MAAVDNCPAVNILLFTARPFSPSGGVPLVNFTGAWGGVSGPRGVSGSGGVCGSVPPSWTAGQAPAAPLAAASWVKKCRLALFASYLGTCSVSRLLLPDLGLVWPLVGC